MAEQDIDPWEGTSGREAASELAHPDCRACVIADAQAPPPKIAASMPQRQLSLRARMLLLGLLPAALCGLTSLELARLGAGLPVCLLVALALLGLAIACAMYTAQELLQPIQKMIAQADLLATRYCGELSARSRYELLALAKSFDAMIAALLAHAQNSRQMYAAEAQNALDLQRQYALMQMLRNLASAANSGEPLEGVLQNCLREIGNYLDWPVGRVMLMARKPTGQIESVRSHWYAPDRARFAGFIDACNRASSQAENTGLIGRAHESNLSHWVCDLDRMQDWSPRQAALACGLRTGFVIPIHARADSAAFVEFFTDHRIEASAEMLELVEAISVELWHTANRYQSEASLPSPGARARRLAAVAENMEEAIVITAADGRIEWANGGLTRLVGFGATQLIGKNLAELLFAGNSTSAAQCLAPIESGSRVVGLMLAERADAADTRWYELEIQSLPDCGTQAKGSFVVVREATQQHAMYVALREAQQRTHPVSQTRPRLLADVSQELRAPINQVLGAVELLLQTHPKERQRRLIEALYRSAEALLEVINDIQDLSQTESGQLQLEMLEFDVRALVESLVEQSAPGAHAKGIELAYRLSSNLPPAVRGDPVRLRQILHKVLDNAINFTERGEVVLTVEVPAEDAAPLHAGIPVPVRFAVRDTGAGMRPETVERLFAQAAVAGPLPPGPAGGFGLALCQRLAELMMGSVRVSSRIGQGSVFQVDIPLQRVDSSCVAPQVAQPPSLAGKRVLIAEDNRTNRRILSEQLAALEMDCALAENGRQALQMLRIAANSASPFDVALIDMKMPFMDGLELADRVRADPRLRALRLVMLTSIAGREDASRAHAAGVDGYLTKPVRYQDLVGALAAAMGTQRPVPGGIVHSAAPPAGALAAVALPIVATHVPPQSSGEPAEAAGHGRKEQEQRVLDEVASLERSGAKDLLRRLAATYEISAKSLLQAAELGFANGDAAAIGQALHAWKLASAKLGAMGFSRACGEIEALARLQRLTDAQMRWQAVRPEHEHVLHALHWLVGRPGQEAYRRMEETAR